MLDARTASQKDEDLFHRTYTYAKAVKRRRPLHCSVQRVTMPSVSLEGTSARWHIGSPSSGDASSDSTDFPFWEYDFPREIWRVRPASQVAIKVAAFIPVMLLGLFGNGAVLLLVCRRRAMQTPGNLLLASMAVSDLFVAAVLPSLTMVEDFFQNWVLGAAMCKLEGFLMLLLTLAGALTLVAVSLLRLLSIAAPAGAVHSRITPAAVIKLAVTLWLVAALLASPLLLWRHYRERQWRNFLEQYCAENQERLGVYWLTVGVLLVWLPLVVILASYAVMFVRLEVSARRATRRGSGAPATARGRDRVAVMLCVASAVYLVCWTPFAAVIVKRYLLPDEAGAVTEAFRALWYAAHYLMYANAAFNPIVYWATNETFRRGFRETFVARGRRATSAPKACSDETGKSVTMTASAQMTQLTAEKKKVTKDELIENMKSLPKQTGSSEKVGRVIQERDQKKTELGRTRTGEATEARKAEEARQPAEKTKRQEGKAEQDEKTPAGQKAEVDLEQGRSVIRL